MKFLFTSILITAIVLQFSSCSQGPCNSKSAFIESYQGFIGELKEKSDNISDEQWDQLDAEFQEFTKVCYKKFREEMSMDEKTEYWDQTASYYAEKYGDNLLSALNENSEEFSQLFDEEMKVAIKDLGDELKKVFDEDFKNDVKKAIDDVISGLGKLGEELKEGIDKIEVEEK